MRYLTSLASYIDLQRLNTSIYMHSHYCKCTREQEAALTSGITYYLIISSILKAPNYRPLCSDNHYSPLGLLSHRRQQSSKSQSPLPPSSGPY